MSTVRWSRAALAAVVTGVLVAGPAFASWRDAPRRHQVSIGPVEMQAAEGGTGLPFMVSHPGNVWLAVCDPNGWVVQVLVDGQMVAGCHTAVWDGCDLEGRPVADGAYLVILCADGQRKTAPFVLHKSSSSKSRSLTASEQVRPTAAKAEPAI